MNRKNVIIFLLWLSLITLPFLFAYLNSTDELVFGGFLINPLDGNSYLAKMQQGYAGFWSFQLPYSSEYNGPAYIFLFYIALGHLARLFHLSVAFVFQAARLISASFMFFMSIQLIRQMDIRNQFIQLILTLTILFGGGLGWLYLLSGDLPADLWVAEAFPLLAALSNPHFCLSIALIIYVLLILNSEQTISNKLLALFITGVLLSIITPFGVAISLILISGNVILQWNSQRRHAIWALLVFCLGSMPMLVYQYWVVSSDPILSGWNSQNITPAPSFINFVLSFSPYLVGCVILVALLARQKMLILSAVEWNLLLWIIGATILLFLPLNLQRRFLVAYYIPVVILFFMLLDRLWVSGKDHLTRQHKNLISLTFVFSLLSPLILLIGVLSAIGQQSSDLYHPKALAKAGRWLQENSKPFSVVLSSRKNGIIIPSFSANKSVFGHPFETVDYIQTGILVDEFWEKKDRDQSLALLGHWGVDYVLVASDLQATARPLVLQKFPVVFDSGQVVIFEVPDE